MNKSLCLILLLLPALTLASSRCASGSKSKEIASAAMDSTLCLVQTDTTSIGMLVNYLTPASIELVTDSLNHEPRNSQYVYFCCVAAFSDNGNPVGSYFDSEYHHQPSSDPAITGGFIAYGYPDEWKFLSSDYEEELAKGGCIAAFAQHMIIFKDIC